MHFPLSKYSGGLKLAFSIRVLSSYSLGVAVQLGSCVWGYLLLCCHAMFPCRRFAFRLGSWFLRLSSRAGPILLLIGPYLGALPVYSPVFNPIELVWSKVKAVLRKLKARTHEELQIALKSALAAITLNDIKNWFKHDGYASI